MTASAAAVLIGAFVGVVAALVIFVVILVGLWAATVISGRLEEQHEPEEPRDE